MLRRSSIVNYIPHRRPSHSNYREWCIEYDLELRNLFSILIESINIENPTFDLFNRFRNMIYNCSSKYIMNKF